MRDIKEIPFSTLESRCSNLGSVAIPAFIKEFALSSKASWLLPQMRSYFGEFKVLKNDTGKYSPKATLANALTNDTFGKGLYRLAMHNKRGDFVPGQYKEGGRNYCALVPLILSGIKSHQYIKYSSWDASELKFIVHPLLLEAMNYVVPEDLTRELLLKIRTIGLTPASGAKMGILKSSTSEYGITGISEFSLSTANPLARMMLVQTWCANPVNRTDDMILDPRDWDSMPEPLVSTDVMKSEPPEPKVLVDAYFDKDKMPWE